MKVTLIVRVGVAVLAWGVAARGQTWDGGGANDNFTAVNNWNPNAVPVNNGTANLVFDGLVRLTPQVNVNFDVARVTFGPTAGGFDIGAINNSTLTVRGGGITNNSAVGQQITAPVTFATD